MTLKERIKQVKPGDYIGNQYHLDRITYETFCFHPGILKWFDFEERFLDCLNRNNGVESVEEIRLEDEADDLWWGLTTQEIDFINNYKSETTVAILKWREKEKEREDKENGI